MNLKKIIIISQYYQQNGVSPPLSSLLMKQFLSFFPSLPSFLPSSFYLLYSFILKFLELAANFLPNWDCISFIFESLASLRIANYTLRPYQPGGKKKPPKAKMWHQGTRAGAWTA